MNIKNIKEGSIIVSPSYLHSALRKSFLTEKSAFANIRICSLSTFILDGEKVEDNSDYEYYQVLKGIQSTLSYNQNSVESYSFIQEVKSFINDMKCFGITLNSLPVENPFQQELKNIISALYQIQTKIDKQIAQNFYCLEKYDFTKVYIIDERASFYEESIYRLFIEKGAHRISESSHVEEKYYYHALNRCQEVESVAQYIIENNIPAEEIKISALSTQYLKDIQQVFERYQIPFYALQQKEHNSILQRFIALLEYYIYQDTKHLKALMLKEVFHHPCTKDFITYITLHDKTLHDSFDIMKDLSISETILSKHELKALQLLETNAQTLKDSISPFLLSLCSIQDTSEVLIKIDDFICSNHPFETIEDRHTLLSIREEIKKSDQYVSTTEDLKFFISILETKKTPIKSIEKGCVISDFAHPLGYYPYHIVLGCSQENFPAFNAKSGIFDELYYQGLSYPTIEERFQFHLNKLQYSLLSSSVVVCFAPLSTIDGKACETSLEIESFLKDIKAQRYVLKHNYKPYVRNYALNKDTAYALFFKNNQLQGSISSLERYMSCPYSYYLRYGLGLKEPIDYTFNYAKSGILSHYIMEYLVKRYGKNYVETTHSELQSLIEHYLDEVAQVYPNDKLSFKQMAKRLLKNIMLNLEVLKDHEIHSSLVPSECEYHFDYTFEIDEKHEILLHGIIDRIDTNQDFLRVIDYKSSTKLLKEELVFSALQLQLITYLVIAQKQFNKRALGAFYYSFAMPNISISYGSLSKRPLDFIEYTPQQNYQTFLKEGRFNGWIFNEHIEAMDDNGAHIVGVRNSLKNGINTSTIYDINALELLLKNIYKVIGNQILDADITCESAPKACTYCPYPSVCARSNHINPKDSIVEVDASLYVKGGKKDATME